MAISPERFFVFFLIMARVLGLFLSAPILSDRAIPQTMKLSMAFWVSLLFWFVVPSPDVHLIKNYEIILALGSEIFLGLVIGFITRIIFVGVQMAGSLMDMQMGLSVAATFDPSTGGQTTIMERLMFYFVIAMIFLTNSHHLLLVALFESFKVIPLVRVVEYRGLIDQMATLSNGIFLTGLDLSMPVLLIIFLLDFSLGLLARLAPQVNVFQLGFQIKPMLGLWIFVFTIPVLTGEVNNLVQMMMSEIYKMFSLVKVY